MMKNFLLLVSANTFLLHFNQTISNPKDTRKPNDPDEPYTVKRVVKGFCLCSENYDVNYSLNGHRGQVYDSATSNIGFR